MLVGGSKVQWVFVLLKFSRDFFLRGFKVLLAIVEKATDFDFFIVVGFDNGKKDWGVVGRGLDWLESCLGIYRGMLISPLYV